MIKFLPFGDHAILINFDQKIDAAINGKIIAFSDAISRAEINEVTFQIPAYCSLTVGFNKDGINYQGLVGKLEKIYGSLTDAVGTEPATTLHVPICYEREFSPDIEVVIKYTGLRHDEIVACHSEQYYRVYMIGFLPGFPYMGMLPEALHSKRKLTPRLKVPAGSVGIAGGQTGIYPVEAPGGWQIIGRTPLKIFNINPELTFLFKTGDRVKFESVSKSSFELLAKDIKNNTFNWRQIYE